MLTDHLKVLNWVGEKSGFLLNLIYHQPNSTLLDYCHSIENKSEIHENIHPCHIKSKSKDCFSLKNNKTKL